MTWESCLAIISSFWADSKMYIEHSIGLSHDALHVIVGPSIQLIVAALMRTSIDDRRPWLVVLVMAFINELYDLCADIWPNQPMQWGESTKDVLLTMALPTLLLILSRRSPALFSSHSDRGSNHTSESPD